MGWLPLFWVFGTIGFQEILIVLLGLLLLFGGRKIPELARGLGRGITEFKQGIRDEPKHKFPEEHSGSKGEESSEAKK